VTPVLKKCKRKLAQQVVYINQILTQQEGSILVLVAVGLVALLACASLVTDIGLLYTSRSRLVNTADAAALAGAQELPINPELAVEVARDYALANGVSENQLLIELGADQRSITVRPRQDVYFLFGRVLGFTEQEVQAAATAFTGALTGAVGVVPFSIQEQELQEGREYVLKNGAGIADSGDDGRMHGWYGALALSGSGANEYRKCIENGYTGMLRVGDRIPIESGNMSGPTEQGVDHRIKQCKDGCTYKDFKPDCPRVMVVPMVSPVSSGKVEVTGFAAFFLEGVGGSGNDNYVSGRFVKMVVSGESGGGTDYGAYVVKLLH
jgi:Flp pilus assembly protein TadG